MADDAPHGNPDDDDGAIEPPEEPRTATEELLDEAASEDVMGVTGPLWSP